MFLGLNCLIADSSLSDAVNVVIETLSQSGAQQKKHHRDD